MIPKELQTKIEETTKILKKIKEKYKKNSAKS